MHNIALLTDFGTADGYDAQLKAVIHSGLPGKVLLTDITHSVPHGNIGFGSFVLKNSYGVFPPGTVFFSVVDPGVGSARSVIFARSGGYFFLGPDNGLMDWALSEHPSGVFEVKKKMRSTFEARDVMAPFLVSVLSGKIKPVFKKRPFRGPRIITDPSGAEGYSIVYKDHFGNLITNISAETELKSLVYKSKKIYPAGCYAEKTPDKRLVKGSSGFWEIAAL